MYRTQNPNARYSCGADVVLGARSGEIASQFAGVLVSSTETKNGNHVNMISVFWRGVRDSNP